RASEEQREEETEARRANYGVPPSRAGTRFGAAFRMARRAPHRSSLSVRANSDHLSLREGRHPHDRREYTRLSAAKSRGFLEQSTARWDVGSFRPPAPAGVRLAVHACSCFERLERRRTNDERILV